MTEKCAGCGVELDDEYFANEIDNTLDTLEEQLTWLDTHDRRGELLWALGYFLGQMAAIAEDPTWVLNELTTVFKAGYEAENAAQLEEVERVH